jgi:hypothetical protein
MADRKISDLTALTTPASGDYLPIVDISEAAAASKNKRITIEELMRGVPNGTAAAPGIAFETDPNTGIYSPGADQLAVATNGTGRLFVDASGRVGIGATPTARLHLQTTSENAVLQMLENNGSTVYGASIDAFNSSGGNIRFRLHDSGGTFQERLRITSAGLVGIGTSAPAELLHVSGGNIRFGSTGFIGEDAGASPAPIRFGANPGATFSVPRDLEFYANIGANPSTVRMILKGQTGNVGIGTTSPSFKLHISGTGNSGAILTEDTTAATSLYFNPSFTTGVPAVQTGTNHPLAFATNNVERARIDTSGRLLVGTSSASEAARAILQGNSFSSSGGCIFKLSRGNATPNDGGDLGNLQFTDSNHVYAANISAKRDGGTWTSGSSQPTRLEFSVTADAASSPTEALRISSNRAITVSDGGNVVLGTTTGTKIGTATTQKLGFFWVWMLTPARPSNL